MIKRLKAKITQMRILMSSIPAYVSICFILSVVAMNLLANKSIEINSKYLALDCGIIVSWVAFLLMDVVTKHFGPKAATLLSVGAILINLVFCLLMFLGSIIPGVWGESYVEGSEKVINHALNRTFGGTWYVLLGSTVAFILSSVINNFTNYGIGKVFRKNPDSVLAYISRSYISTAIGQFADNMIFAFLVSRLFFGWTSLQCFTCAVTGMLAELFCEVIFSGFGYRICKKWKENKVGEEYLKLFGEDGQSAESGVAA